MKILPCLLFSLTVAVMPTLSLVAMEKNLDLQSRPVGFNPDNPNHMFLQVNSYLSCEALWDIFTMLREEEGEGVKLMGVRIAYAHNFNMDIDHLECVYFLKNIKSFVNGDGICRKTELFSKEHLPNILPFLGALIQEPITKISLSRDVFESLPPELKKSFYEI